MKGLFGAFGILAIPFGLALAILVFSNPTRTLYTTIIMSFLISGLSRYVKLPWGLSIDIMLVLAWLVLFIKDFRNLKTDYLKNDFMALSVVWMGFVILLIANPESRSLQAWFYAMRGVGFYFLLVLGLTLMLLRDKRHLDHFIKLVISLSIFGAFWAMKQKFIGVDSYEHHWLWVEGHWDEHVLFGVLRAFSFYSDAGQFGASQAMVSMMCGILLFQKNISLSQRVLYASGMILTFIGFGISGSRGALAIPAMGGIAFLVLSKNFKLLILGSLMMVTSFSVLKYTHIGHGIEQVRRMRTALAPDNPSLMARKRNQKTFARHLSSRPLGGGIGSAGYWGNRFSPNTLLAETPTDSYYVKIWAETGIIGVGLHVLILGYFMGAAAMFIQGIKSFNLKYKAIAIYSSVFGVLAASYGNQVFSQMPTGIIMSVAIGLLYLVPRFDEQTLKTIES